MPFCSSCMSSFCPCVYGADEPEPEEDEEETIEEEDLDEEND